MDPKEAVRILTEQGPIEMRERLRIADWIQRFFFPPARSTLVTSITCSHGNGPSCSICRDIRGDD